MSKPITMPTIHRFKYLKKSLINNSSARVFGSHELFSSQELCFSKATNLHLEGDIRIVLKQTVLEQIIYDQI